MKQTLLFPRQLNDADAGFFFLGRRPRCNVAMVMLAVLPEPLDYEAMLAELLAAADEVPRFLDCLQRSPLDITAPSWAPAKFFEPREQIRQVGLPEGATWDHALRMADALQESPFPADRPPWEILHINGCPGGRSLFVMKVHHALSDGTALSLLFAKAFGKTFLQNSDIQIEATSEPPPHTSRLRLAAADKARATRASTARALRRLPEIARKGEARAAEGAAIRQLLSPWHRHPPGEYGPSRRLSGFRVPAEHWNATAASKGGTANDLYLAIVARAMGRHFPDWDLVAQPLQIVMPVNVRGDEGVQDGGNVTGVSVVELDGSPEHLRDLSEVRRRSSVAKQRAESIRPTVVGELVQGLPGGPRSALQYREFATRDVVATNVPVPIPGELCGVPFEMIFMVAPSIGATASFSLTSYGDHLHLAINADTGIVEGDLDATLGEILEETFGTAPDALRETATSNLSSTA